MPRVFVDAKLARWMIALAIANLGVSQAHIFMRPELQFRSSAEDLYHIAQALEEKAAYDQAIHMYKEIVEVAGHTDLGPTAAYQIAKLYMRKKFEMYQARDALKVAAEFRGSAAAARAEKDLDFVREHWGADGSQLRLWFQASEAVRAGQPDRALGFLAPLSAETPAVSLRPDALFQTGRIYVDKGMTPEAIAAYETLLKDFPNHELAERVRPLLAKMK